MRESRRYSNSPVGVEDLIGLLLNEPDRRLRQRVLKAIDAERDRVPAPRLVLKPKHGSTHWMVLAVLKEASKPMSPKDIRVAVERRLKRHVSGGTVSSSLHSSVKNPKVPVVRVGEGLYEWQPAP
jgi:hypothetical protein